jgi:hypothetical protein
MARASVIGVFNHLGLLLKADDDEMVAAMSDETKAKLIFHPGLSTASEISDISIMFILYQLIDFLSQVWPWACVERFNMAISLEFRQRLIMGYATLMRW